MFKKILVANRGEIAVRIIRACREMGISPAAVYSEADRQSLHVTLADEAYCLGPAPSSESYLVIEKIIDAALQCGAQAVHPGYGFLAEDEAFAQACEDSGIAFIGPSPASMRIMGDKIGARAAVQKAGVPVVPGTTQALQSFQEAAALAAKMGYPVMLKASAGGGGKGLRKVDREADLRSAYDLARSEAQSSFNDPTLFLEQYLEKPRHIEVQLLGDRHGHLIFLGERECSIQRRHQKLVEECPSPVVDEKLRTRLGQAAVAAAKAANYYNAGTVEFLADANLNFYFLEMNTRLQVEHPVTEMVTGIDIVREQIRIAAGEKLRYQQEEVQLSGAAVECRVYAEDPQNNFFPSPGLITTFFEPSGPGIRNDSGVYAGCTIPIHYDPLISKLIAHGEDRTHALARMRRGLGEYRIGGVQTTLPFFKALLSHPEFIKGNLHTHFIEEHGLVETLTQAQGADESVPLIAAALDYFLRSGDTQPEPIPSTGNAWKQFAPPRGRLRRWRELP